MSSRPCRSSPEHQDALAARTEADCLRRPQENVVCISHRTSEIIAAKVPAMFEPSSPDAVVYRHHHVVLPQEIDELGHASNVMFVRWVQDAAKAASADRGWDRGAYLKLGSVFVVRRHEVDYLLPAMEGDELELHTWIEAWTAATSVRTTRIVRARDQRDVGRASTTWALVAADTGRPTRIPVEMKSAFGKEGG